MYLYSKSNTYSRMRIRKHNRPLPRQTPRPGSNINRHKMFLPWMRPSEKRMLNQSFHILISFLWGGRLNACHDIPFEIFETFRGGGWVPGV